MRFEIFDLTKLQPGNTDGICLRLVESVLMRNWIVIRRYGSDKIVLEGKLCEIIDTAIAFLRIASLTFLAEDNR